MVCCWSTRNVLRSRWVLDGTVCFSHHFLVTASSVEVRLAIGVDEPTQPAVYEETLIFGCCKPAPNQSSHRAHPCVRSCALQVDHVCPFHIPKNPNSMSMDSNHFILCNYGCILVPVCLFVKYAAWDCVYLHRWGLLFHWWGLLYGGRNVWIIINCCWCEWRKQ